MTTLIDKGNNLKELTRVFGLEVNSPYVGSTSVVLKREKLLLLDGKVISQSQLEPIIKNYSESAKTLITVFDPITGKSMDISLLALVSALQSVDK
jgi:hypothetical protein